MVRNFSADAISSLNALPWIGMNYWKQPVEKLAIDIPPWIGSWYFSAWCSSNWNTCVMPQKFTILNVKTFSETLCLILICGDLQTFRLDEFRTLRLIMRWWVHYHKRIYYAITTYYFVNNYGNTTRQSLEMAFIHSNRYQQNHDFCFRRWLTAICH